ncbi:MAG: F0F1 ATP synthase subunit B' [Beijerinckiaceae bacterium]
MIFSFIGTAHAADAVKAKAGSAFPPFDASTFPGQIFWLVLTFGVLYYLMSKVALPRVTEILETRENKIDGDLKAAAMMQEKARMAGEAYEKLLSDAKANAQGIGQKAKDVANATADQQRKIVEADTARTIAASEARIAAARDQAMTNVSGIAADTATEIVKRISGVAPKADELKRVIAAIQS